MFTGIVEAMGLVETLSRRSSSRGSGWRLRVRLPGAWPWSVGEGESVAVSGVCLTVVEPSVARLAFDLVDETIRVTTLGDVRPDDPVNLERPLRLDTRLGGHLVLGHVDGVGTVRTVEAEGEGRRLTVEVPASLRPFLIPRGSVTVEGVSLTIADLGESTFGVALIPHTLVATTLGIRVPGDRVNLEMDVIGKYVRAFLLSGEGAREVAAPQGVTGLMAPAQEA